MSFKSSATCFCLPEGSSCFSVTDNLPISIVFKDQDDLAENIEELSVFNMHSDLNLGSHCNMGMDVA